MISTCVVLSFSVALIASAYAVQMDGIAMRVPEYTQELYTRLERVHCAALQKRGLQGSIDWGLGKVKLPS